MNAARWAALAAAGARRAAARRRVARGRPLALALAGLALSACAASGPQGAAPAAAPGGLGPVTEDAGFQPGTMVRVDSIIQAALADHAAPGAALAVGLHGRLVRLRGYGALDYRPGFGAATDSTIWDLASLSKVIGATTATMWAVEHAGLDIEKPVSHYLPEFGADPRKQAITVRQLLIHTSGLPAFLPFYRDTRGRAGYLRRISEIPLQYEPGTKTVYSDFNFILMGLIVERLAGKPLDVLLREKVFGPLGMRDTGYNLLLPPGVQVPPDTDCTFAYRPDAPLLERIAPTEVDTIYRHRHVQGIVHDENACALGGVSGNAGLFSSARDLAVFAQMMLNGGIYRGTRVLRAATIRNFTTRQGAGGSSRALGWDTPGGTGSAVPGVFSPASFGHTGFTGTSIYVDPTRDLFVVLLTNRVNPTRDNQKIGPLRRAVAQAVVGGIAAAPEKAAQP